MKFLEDFKHRKWYVYVLFVLLYASMLGAIFAYTMAFVFVVGMTVSISYFPHIWSDVLFIANFAIPIIIIDFLTYLLRKKKTFRFKMYGKHLVIISIPILLSLLFLFFYEVYMLVTGDAAFYSGATYF